MQSMGPYSANKTAEYLWCCRYIAFLSNLTVSLSILEQWSEFGLCLLASNAGSTTMHHFFGSTGALTGENMLHNCRTYQGIATPFLMNILWKTSIAYSVHRQKVLKLLMNLERKQSLFSSQRINSLTTGHFSPHQGSFLSHTTNFAHL